MKINLMYTYENMHLAVHLKLVFCIISVFVCHFSINIFFNNQKKFISSLYILHLNSSTFINVTFSFSTIINYFHGGNAISETEDLTANGLSMVAVLRQLSA